MVAAEDYVAKADVIAESQDMGYYNTQKLHAVGAVIDAVGVEQNAVEILLN